MPKRINHILVCCFCILSVFACNTAKIPTEYRFKPKEVSKVNTGCWIRITKTQKTISEPEITLAGELIAMQADTFFILTDVQLNNIPSAEIKKAVMYIYNNQAVPFILVTTLLLIPNIIAAIVNDSGGFLLLDIPALIGGTYFSLNEGISGSHQMKYPEKEELKDFSKFARFPQGIPPGLNIENLRLKHSIKN